MLLAYGRIYIDNLRSKVTALFDELKVDNRLCEENFIEAFKRKYPKDYAMLQYEWEFKIHEFKKNRKGNPKSHPIRPDKILSNMYRNYYFKLVKHPAIKKSKDKLMTQIQSKAGQLGYKIIVVNGANYNVVCKEEKIILYENISFAELKNIFMTNKGILKLNKLKSNAIKMEVKSDV